MDEEYRDPHLAAIYDVLDADRRDLDHYVSILTELGARRVLDIGCGTGVLALRLAAAGCDVIGVDPAVASLEVARAKPGAGRVRWMSGGAGAAGVDDRDAAVMTANVAMAIDGEDWAATLAGAHDALRPDGHLVFETRRPDATAWQRWDRSTTFATTTLPSGGSVESWVELTSVSWPRVRLRWTFRFCDDGVTLTSDSLLRYRELDELRRDLDEHGFDVVDVRDAPDRPGREWVVLGRRRDGESRGHVSAIC